MLGRPLIPAQENHDPRKTWNPTFELAYWREALAAAQTWRARQGLPAIPKWEGVRRDLSALPVKDGVYLAHENCPQTFTERNYDHPSMPAALGVLNGDGVDRTVMRRTLHRVMPRVAMGGYMGLGFSDDSDDSSAIRRAGKSHRCAVHRVAEEYMAAEWSQLAAR